MVTPHRHFILRIIAAGMLVPVLVMNVLANPTGMTVVSGTATASQTGPQLTITASQNAFLNWQSFNIAAGETTTFLQPSAASIVWNRINDQNPSQIYGSLQANGVVVLMNSSGFYFGPNSFVRTAGLVLSTANCIPPQNSGGTWEFNGPPPAASIINYGKINVNQGGSAFLIAQNVMNFGDITAPGGTISIAAGQDVFVSERPDGRGLSMKVNLPEGSVDNEGHLVADAGTISVNAQTVNQNGLLQANSVRDQNGVIELVASDQLNLGAHSQISASGDGSIGGSAGGTVTLQSGNTFSDASGGSLSIAGGAQGGNGGSVEISAPTVASLNTHINGQAQPGWLGGTFLLDPDYIVLNQSGGNSLNVSGASGSLLVGASPGNTLYLNVGNSGDNFLDSAFLGLSQITLQAKYDITLASGTTWSLSDSTGQTAGQLLLEAGRDIYFQDGSSIFDANNWSVTLKAGVNNFNTGTVQPGVGNIFLNGGPAGDGIGGSIQTATGNIDLEAGQDITVGSGYVITTGGGSISAHALAGSIDTGTDAQGYHFVNNANSLNAAYNLQNGLGGINTAAGGDVTLIAGGDVTSFLPGANIQDDSGTAGSGAYGRTQHGDVTVVAGGNVTGHYLVADGTGSIFAGVKMDANGNPITDASGNYVLGTSGSAGTDPTNPNFALSLINGGWNVAAAQNILLQEVSNPNGIFNHSGAYKHYFDYAPDAFVNLSAGNMVQLGASASSLARLKSNLDPLKIPVIYPPILNIKAGDGGIILGTRTSPNSLTLFPSAQGSLTIDTTGSLVNGLNSIASAPQLFNLIVSDAGHNQYTTTANFGTSDHAASPIHANSPTPIYLNVAGNMNYIDLTVPEAAQINVGGNMNNCAFQGMNLSLDPAFQVQVHEADGSTRLVTVDPGVTSIDVAGDIFNRSAFTSVNLSQIAGAQGIDLSLLAQAVSDPALVTSFYYNPATQTLIYQNINGRTLLSVLQELNNLTIQQFINGVPQWQDPPFDTIPATENVSVLGDPAQPGTAAYALLAQYNALNAAPYALPNNASSYSYSLGGGGQFDITARTIDLGTSAGIQSEGVALYSIRGSYPLAGLFGNDGVFAHGADINITTTGNHSAGSTGTGEPLGDLDMFSSSIASVFGGNISINASGDVNAGSSVFNVNTFGATGIYSTSQGDVSVIADGDINVNGSRITTYDGGNVTVESLNGNVNAGTGASLPVGVTGYYEDPVSQAVYSTSPQIPFSGILALTFPARSAAYPAPPAVLGNIFIEAPNGSVNANAAGILQIPLNNLNYPDATTTVLAGYQLNNSGQPVFALDNQNIVTFGSTSQLPVAGQPVLITQLLDAGGVPVLDANGHQVYVENLGAKGGQLVTFSVAGGKITINPYLDVGGNPVNVVSLTGTQDAQGNPLFVYGRNIDVKGSGLIASNVKLLATGDINGLIFARDNLDINAQHTVDITALAGGSANISGQQVIGTISAVTGENVSGDSVTADLISANVSGATSGQSGLGQGAAASSASQGLANNASTQAVADADSTDDDKKKKGQGAALVQKTSRVTVILPPKNLSETQTRNHHS